MLLSLRREMAVRRVHGSGPSSKPVTKRAKAIFALAATIAFGVPVLLKAREDGTGVGLVLAIVSVTTLTLALRAVIRARRQGSNYRTISSLLTGLMLWSAFMLGLMTVAPGAPLAHGEIVRGGTAIPLEAGAAGRRMTLLVRGRIRDASADAVDFTVTAGTVAIRGRLARTQRRVRIAGRIERTMDPDGSFARVFDVPLEATMLTVTTIDGPLDGPVVVELFPMYGGLAVAVIAFAALVFLVILADGVFQVPGYAGAMGAGLGASLLIAGTSPPGWRLEPAIMAVAFGTIGGLLLGLAGAHIVRRLRPREAHEGKPVRTSRGGRSASGAP